MSLRLTHTRSRSNLVEFNPSTGVVYDDIEIHDVRADAAELDLETGRPGFLVGVAMEPGQNIANVAAVEVYPRFESQIPANLVASATRVARASRYVNDPTLGQHVELWYIDPTAFDLGNLEASLKGDSYRFNVIVSFEMVIANLGLNPDPEFGAVAVAALYLDVADGPGMIADFAVNVDPNLTNSFAVSRQRTKSSVACMLAFGNENGLGADAVQIDGETVPQWAADSESRVEGSFHTYLESDSDPSVPTARTVSVTSQNVVDSTLVNIAPVTIYAEVVENLPRGEATVSSTSAMTASGSRRKNGGSVTFSSSSAMTAVGTVGTEPSGVRPPNYPLTTVPAEAEGDPLIVDFPALDAITSLDLIQPGSENRLATALRKRDLTLRETAQKLVEDTNALGGLYIQVDGTTPLDDDLNVNGHGVVNIGTSEEETDVATFSEFEDEESALSAKITSGSVLTVDGLQAMQDDLPMQQYRLTGVGPGTSARHLIIREQADDAYWGPGAAMLTDLEMGDRRIRDVRAPADPSDLANKDYVDAKFAGAFTYIDPVQVYDELIPQPGHLFPLPGGGFTSGSQPIPYGLAGIPTDVSMVILRVFLRPRSTFTSELNLYLAMDGSLTSWRRFNSEHSYVGGSARADLCWAAQRSVIMPVSDVVQFFYYTFAPADTFELFSLSIEIEAYA